MPAPQLDLEAESEHLRVERERLGFAVRDLNAATVTLVDSVDADKLREHAARLLTLTTELQAYHAAVEAYHKRLVTLLERALSRGGSIDQG